PGDACARRPAAPLSGSASIVLFRYEHPPSGRMSQAAEELVCATCDLRLVRVGSVEDPLVPAQTHLTISLLVARSANRDSAIGGGRVAAGARRSATRALGC